MAKVRTSSREDAMKIARYVGCTGAHQDENGNWLPCSSAEKLAEISNRAESKSAMKRDKKKRRRYINRDWENLPQRGVISIDTIEGGGLVSGFSKSLTQWFKEEWVDISRPKKGGGFEPCGRSDADKGKYPKCVPAARASRMSEEEIRSAVSRKRRAESTQQREDKKPIYVATDKKSEPFFIDEKSAIPTDPELYARVKAEAKKKFDVYPSAYANAWLVREYKKRGGGYRSEKTDDGDYEESIADLTEMQLSDFFDWFDGSQKVDKVCPPATSDISLNIKNRQKAIDDAGYGPLNPEEPNVSFWEKKARRWSVTITDSKKQTCGNCAAFIKTPRMLDCIDKGLGNEEGNASWDVIDAGELGYCEAFDFKCASARTCDAWISGGPITEEKATTEEKAATSTIIIGRAKPRLGDPDVYTDPNAARLRARKLGCIGIARRETPEGEIVWTPCTNVSDQRRRQGDTPLGRRDEARRFADMLQEVGGPARKRQRMRKYKTLVYQVDYKQLRSIGSQLRSPMQTIGRNIGRAGKCRGSARGMRSIRDGDGDGFICNPATGKDDLPIVGGNQMLQRFFQQLTEEKKGWSQKFKDNPFRADDTSFNTPDGDADKMLQNLVRRGWLVKDQGTSIQITPPPEFRKRYLAVRAIKGEGAVDSIDGPDSIFNIGYHKWHPGNDHTGPEKELASKLLKNFGYDPLNDTLYSPYYDSPNGYDQIKDPNNIRKFANGVIPEFEGAPNAEKYLTDKPGAPEFKKPSVIDETLSRDIAKLDNERNIAQFQNLVQAGKAKYGNKDRTRKLDANSDDSVDEVEDFLALHEAGYGTDEVAEILNIDEDNLVNFMNDEGFNVSKGRIKSIIESLEKEEELRRKRRAQAGNQQGPRRAPARGVVFREGQAAIPPKLNINQEATGRFTYGEHKEFLKFSAWADGTYKPPVRKEVLRAYLDQNPRTKALLRAENDRWFQKIYDLNEPHKPAPQEIIDYWDQWFLENIEGMISGAKNEVPKEILGLGLIASDLRRLIDIIVSKEKEEAMAALRDKPELLEMYDNVSWLRLLPLIGNARKARRLFADRIAEQRAMGRKDDLSFEVLHNAQGETEVFVKAESPTLNLSGFFFDDSTIATLANKVSEHNGKMRSSNKPDWSMASITKLKSVYRRGATAFPESDQLDMDRDDYAMDRVDAFLSMLRTGRPNSGKYVADNDLLHDAHPWKKRGVRQKSAYFSGNHIEHKTLRTIGGSIGRGRTPRPASYEPNAFDGDNDGKVQDDTPFERPASVTNIDTPDTDDEFALDVNKYPKVIKKAQSSAFAEKRKQIAQDLRNGLPQAETAKKHGVSTQIVEVVRRLEKIPSAFNAGKKIDPEIKKNLIEFVEKLIKDNNPYLSTTNIAKQFNLPANTARQILEKANLQEYFVLYKNFKEKKDKQFADNIIELWNSGLNNYEIADRLNVTLNQVTAMIRTLRARGVNLPLKQNQKKRQPRRIVMRGGKQMTQEEVIKQDNEIFDLYQKGRSLGSLAKEFDMYFNQIHQILARRAKARNIALRENTAEEYENLAKELLKEGVHPRDITKNYIPRQKMPVKRILEIAEEEGIEIPPLRSAKSRNFIDNWGERKVLPTIGGSRGRRFRRRASVYDPNAFDGDGDGKIQDETPFERPATPKRTVSLAELFERLKDPDGGFTISVSNMDDVKSGWAIARRGQGIKIPASTIFGDDGNATEEGIDHLEAFLEMHKELFLAKPGKTRQITLGAWHDPETKQIYFDVTDVYSKDSMSLEQAIAEANKQNQISIADLDELHAAIENDDWDNRTIFHSGGGDGKDLLPEGRFNKYLDFVRSRGADDRTNERSSDTKPTQRKVVISDDGVDMMFASPIEELAEKHGVKQDWQEVRALPQPRRQEIADLYDEAEDLPAEEIQQEVREAYEALVKEVEEQFEILTKELGINVEFVDEDPYGNFYEMLDDYQTNKRLKIMRTSVTGSHPFMTDEQNDMFRAVHDAFGHLATGRGFDRHGEEAAYQAHKSMFSSTAVKAAATELRGQNAFLLEKGFFGPQKLVILPESMRKYLDILLGFKEAEKRKKMTAQEWSDFDNAYTNTGSHHVSLGRVVKR